MEIRYSANPRDIVNYDTEELRNEFIFDNFFKADKIIAAFTFTDRVLLGGAVPTTTTLCFDDFISGKDMGAETPMSGREMACINLGGDGYVISDDVRYDVGYTTAMYIGMNSQNITFGSVDSECPAKFYFFSTPAHCRYETKVITKEMAVRLDLGSAEECNQRTIHQYIQPAVTDSCQVLLGYTQLAPGSVWNSMPTHTHARRSEVYMYFNMKESDRVIHLMGEPTNTRHLIMGNEQAVFSPCWSVHAGVGSGQYGFIWGMAGENRTLSDADAYAIGDLI